VEDCVTDFICEPVDLDEYLLEHCLADIDESRYWQRVVSVRGTLSLEDCVTDFMRQPVDLDEYVPEQC